MVMDAQTMENPGGNAKIAIIILNWNGRKLLAEFLPSVVMHHNPELSDVIVADNGSDDDSVLFLQENFPTVKVWEFDRNYGFAEGYNRALALAEAYEFVVLLNSDVAVSSGWDEAMYTAMKNRPEVAAAQPKIRSYVNPENFEYAGAAGGYLDKNGYPYCRGRIFNVCETDNGQYDVEADIFWASGACMMVRREDYINAGGLDRDFFAHMEEIDLCWRFHLMGKDVIYVPGATVYHLGGGSLPAQNPRKTYLNFRNNLLMLHKNLPASTRKKVLLRRRLLDTVAWGRYMLTFDFANANAILKAHLDFKKMRKAYNTDPTTDYLPSTPEGRRNILFDFYLRRKRTFGELQ